MIKKNASWNPYLVWMALSNFRFSLEIETYYTPDGGHQENVFNLSDSEMRNRIVDLIDVVKDQVRKDLILIRYLQGVPFQREFSMPKFILFELAVKTKVSIEEFALIWRSNSNIFERDLIEQVLKVDIFKVDLCINGNNLNDFHYCRNCLANILCIIKVMGSNIMLDLRH